MSAEVWPQPVTDEHPWHERRLPQRDIPSAATFVVREVRLWGRTVLIDESNDVWCSDCWEFVPVERLGRIDNTHSVGIVRRRSGQLIPADLSGTETSSDEERF